MDNMQYFRGALNTIRAPRWKVWAAKLFGKKSVGQDSGCTVTFHTWRGHHYLTDLRHDT